MLGLHCCTRAFSSHSKPELHSSCGVRGFSCCRAGPRARASAIAARGLSSYGAQASLPHSMCNLPGPGIKAVYPVLAGGLLTTGPPGKSLHFNLYGRFPGFPYTSVGKEPACSAGDPGSIPGSGRSPEEGNGNPLQYSCLENPKDRGPWRAVVHGVASRAGHDLATK